MIHVNVINSARDLYYFHLYFARLRPARCCVCSYPFLKQNNARKKPLILEPSSDVILEIEVARKNYRSGKEIKKLRHGRNWIKQTVVTSLIIQNSFFLPSTVVNRIQCWRRYYLGKSIKWKLKCFTSPCLLF